MMTSVTGIRGIGKTYMLSKELYRRSQEGFFTVSNFSHVYANVDISKESPDTLYQLIREIGIFKERGYEMCDLDPRFIHSGIFIAIDEAHLYFSADLFKRYQQDVKFLYVLKFLAQARKSDVEIWYSSQDPAKVDINWRRYTEEYIRYVPFFPISWKKDILVQRPRRSDGTMPLPYYRREIRYPIPLLREEHHTLDPNNPVFNYQVIATPDGGYQLGPSATLDYRRFVRSGWMDPFPYKLYDSYQMLSMQGDPEEKDFPNLINFGYIEHTMRPDKFPTFKKWLGLRRTDVEVPKRQIVKDRKLPQEPGFDSISKSVLMQPVEFLDNLTFFNEMHSPRPVVEGRRFLRRLARAQRRKPALTQGVTTE